MRPLFASKTRSISSRLREPRSLEPVRCDREPSVHQALPECVVAVGFELPDDGGIDVDPGDRPGVEGVAQHSA